MLFIILLVFGLGLYFYSYRVLDAPISGAVRAALTASRFVFFILILYLLSRPFLQEIQSVTLYPSLFVVLDDSQSMDQPIHPGTNEQNNQPTRWETVQKTLLEDDVLANWSDEGFELQIGLLSDLSLMEDDTAQWSANFPGWATPSFSYTNLADAVKSFKQQRLQEIPSYLLLFTDGQYNQGKNPLAEISSDFYQAEGESFSEQRIFTFGIGTTLNVFDIILDSVQAPNTMRAGDALNIYAHLDISGQLTEPSINLLIEGVNQDGVVIHRDEEVIDIEGETNEVEHTFTINDLPEGEYEFTVTAEPHANEIYDENNQQSVGVRVISAEDKILMLTSAPNWEFKFLKRVIEDQENLDVDAYLHHENGLTSLGDRQWVEQQAGLQPDEETDIVETLEALNTQLTDYSAVVLNNFRFLNRNVEFARQLSNYIENGGGLIFIPGNMQEESLSSEIQAVLPPAITKTMLPTIIYLQVNNQQDFMQSVYPDRQIPMPPLYPYYRIEGQQNEGQVLLSGNTSNQESLPLITLIRYGLGSIIRLNTNSFWRWQMQTEETSVIPFWLNLLYRVNPNLANRQHQLYTDGFLYDVMEPVQVTYVADTIDSGTTTGVAIKVQRPDETVDETLIWLSQAEAGNRFQNDYIPVEPGQYVFQDTLGTASATIQVEPNRREIFDVRQNVALLREMAERTGGGYANSPNWENLANQIPQSTKTIEQTEATFLGEKWWYAALLILFLGLEWFLRWRQGLP